MNKYDINNNFRVDLSILSEDPELSNISLSEHVRDISVKNNYLENVLPLFVIQLQLTNELRGMIRDNDVELNLTVSLIDVPEDESETQVTDLLPKEIIYSTVLRLYNKPKEYSEVLIDEDNESETNIENLAEKTPFIVYTVLGVPKDQVYMNHNLINSVYSQCMLDEVIVNLISLNNSNDIMLQPIDNNEFYESILIPPYNLIPAIRFLDDVYSIYDSPLGLFFDVDKSYIYSHFNNNNPERTLNINVLPTSETSDSNLYSRPKIDENGNIYVYLRANPVIISNDEITNDLVGNKMYFSSYDNEFNIVNRSVTSNEFKFDKERHIWNNNKSKLSEDKFYNHITKSTFSNIVLSNIDHRYFNPMTRVILNGTDDDISGEYSIAEMSYNISSSDKLLFKNLVSLKLIKI